MLKSKCYDQIELLADNYNLKINEVRNNLNKEIIKLKKENAHLLDDNIPDEIKRKTIPKAIKNKCWNINIGKNNGIGLCFVCGETEIDSKHFEAGHIISIKNGGQNNVSNLKPVCEECNKYMGSKNMDEYIKEIADLSK